MSAHEIQPVPIFPLPQTVFFPKTILPLHLFEPRYRQMAQDLVEGDGRLVVVLLRPGWQADYEAAPPVHAIATLGRLTFHERQDDGRYNIVLEGVQRVRLDDHDWQPGQKLYRLRAARPADERQAPPGSAEEQRAWTLLREAWAGLTRVSAGDLDGIQLADELTFEGFVNRLASEIPLPAATRQALLEEDDLTSRARALASTLIERRETLRMLQRFRSAAPSDPGVN